MIKIGRFKRQGGCSNCRRVASKIELNIHNGLYDNYHTGLKGV